MNRDRKRKSRPSHRTDRESITPLLVRFLIVGSQQRRELLATQSEAETHLVQAWSHFMRGKTELAASSAQDAADELQAGADEGWAPDCQSPARPRFRDWWIANPSRWFRRRNKDEAPVSSDVEPTTTTKVRRTMKKLIGLVVISAAAGVGSNYLASPFNGPTQLDRGEFAAVQQCESCETIRSTDVDICVDCGSTKAIEKIAAPLTHPWMGFFARCHDGWQFKDGSTTFDDAGEYIVPELVVSKTMRM